MDRPFVIDSVADETVGYDALARAVLGPTIHFRPRCRAARLAEGFINFVSALAADRDLTLVDADFSERELADLGLDAPALAAVEAVPAVRQARDLSELLVQIRAACRTRITLFTSGSTGLPKAVSHALPNLCRALRVGDKHAADVWGFAYNPTHIAGVQVFLQVVFNQNSLVNLFQLPRERVLDLLREHRVTHLSATPTFYRLLLPADAPLPDVKAVTLGGERTDAALIERLRALFPNARFRNLYASTEAGTLLSAEGDLFSIPTELADRIQLRDGRLHLHRSLLGDFDGRAVAAGDWYDTGDVVEVASAEPLRFRIVSRDRDWVNVGGNKVNPAEVEMALAEHPQVREARVFGRANPVLGKILCAEVVPGNPPPGEPEIRQFLAARLQPFKVPRVIRLVPSIDKTRTGKLRRDD
jgi:acyl-coenzyme A synthetase/AMP-(fatty) acid ligase